VPLTRMNGTVRGHCDSRFRTSKMISDLLDSVHHGDKKAVPFESTSVTASER
jgi:hypothetical protein